MPDKETVQKKNIKKRYTDLKKREQEERKREEGIAIILPHIPYSIFFLRQKFLSCSKEKLGIKQHLRMKEKNFTRFMDTMIENLKTGNALGTAHIYQASKNAFITFLGKEEIYFRQIKPELLKCFEYFLRSRGNSWNTVSTYMRVLRAVYNRAVDRKLAPYMPRLFKKVYTGTRTDIKRALRPEDMGRLLNTQSTRKQTETLRRTHQLFVLMFLLRGLPFVDLAYLQKTDLDGNTLTYHRHKTGSPLTVTVPKEAMDIINEWKNTDPDATYLFPILEENEKSQDNYRVYQQALRTFNYQLAKLANLLGSNSNISSYVAKHYTFYI